MTIYDLVLWLVFYLLLAFGVSLVLLGLYFLLTTSFRIVRQVFHTCVHWGRTRHRVGEIHAIGRQARTEMQRLYDDYLHQVSPTQRR